MVGSSSNAAMHSLHEPLLHGGGGGGGGGGAARALYEEGQWVEVRNPACSKTFGTAAGSYNLGKVVAAPEPGHSCHDLHGDVWADQQTSKAAVM